MAIIKTKQESLEDELFLWNMLFRLYTPAENGFLHVSCKCSKGYKLSAFAADMLRSQ
jgi:hypothetical protein